VVRAASAAATSHCFAAAANRCFAASPASTNLSSPAASCSAATSPVAVDVASVGSSPSLDLVGAGRHDLRLHPRLPGCGSCAVVATCYACDLESRLSFAKDRGGHGCGCGACHHGGSGFVCDHRLGRHVDYGSASCANPNASSLIATATDFFAEISIDPWLDCYFSFASARATFFSPSLARGQDSCSVHGQRAGTGGEESRFCPWWAPQGPQDEPLEEPPEVPLQDPAPAKDVVSPPLRQMRHIGPSCPMPFGLEALALGSPLALACLVKHFETCLGRQENCSHSSSWAEETGCQPSWEVATCCRPSCVEATCCATSSCEEETCCWPSRENC